MLITSFLIFSFPESTSACSGGGGGGRIIVTGLCPFESRFYTQEFDSFPKKDLWS